MKADQTALWLPRLAIAGLGLVMVPSGFASYLEGGTYQVVTTDASPSDTTATLTLNDTTQMVTSDLSVTATVIPDSSSANSEWIDFNFEAVNGAPLAANPDALWEIAVNNIPLSSPGYLTGFAAYWTVNGVAATNIKPITGFPTPSTNPINPSLGEAYSETIAPSGTAQSSIDVYAYVAPYATELTAGGMNPSTVNGFTLDALVTNASTSSVPEPSTFALGSLAIFGLLFAAVRRQRAAD